MNSSFKPVMNNTNIRKLNKIQGKDMSVKEKEEPVV